MLIYVEEILGEIDDMLEYAQIVREKFGVGRDASELLLDARCLDKRMNNLYAMLPDSRMIGNGLRHTHFMIYYLKDGNEAGCVSDINDICESDLPGTARAIREWSSKLAWVDADLRRDILPLIRFCQFDSAIRKAFVILKSRLCRKFNLDEKMDGVELVNTLFGSKSTLFPKMSSGERESYRSLFAGMFGLLRNRFAHNDLMPDLSDLDTAIANINMCLRIVDDFRDEPTDV